MPKLDILKNKTRGSNIAKIVKTLPCHDLLMDIYNLDDIKSAHFSCDYCGQHSKGSQVAFTKQCEMWMSFAFLFYRAGVYWIYILSIHPSCLKGNFQYTPALEKRSRVRMNWKIRPPRQFAPIDPLDCPRAISQALGCKLPQEAFFQYIPPLGSVLLQFIPTRSSVLPFFFPEQELIGNYIPSINWVVLTVYKFNTLLLYKKECIAIFF